MVHARYPRPEKLFCRLPGGPMSRAPGRSNEGYLSNVRLCAVGHVLWCCHPVAYEARLPIADLYAPNGGRDAKR